MRRLLWLYGVSCMPNVCERYRSGDQLRAGISTPAAVRFTVRLWCACLCLFVPVLMPSESSLCSLRSHTAMHIDASLQVTLIIQLRVEVQPRMCGLSRQGSLEPQPLLLTTSGMSCCGRSERLLLGSNGICLRLAIETLLRLEKADNVLAQIRRFNVSLLTCAYPYTQTLL